MALPWKANPRVFMDIMVEQRQLGRLVFELRAGCVPKTVENFRALCNHTRGFGYSGSTFHRIIPGQIVQGGDFDKGDGSGGPSIWGGNFEDENFTLPHNKRGVLSMANFGVPDTNGAQFFITCNAAPFLDRRHVVFGEMVDGFGVLGVIESLGTHSGEPEATVYISKCGDMD